MAPRTPSRKTNKSKKPIKKENKAHGGQLTTLNRMTDKSVVFVKTQRNYFTFTGANLAISGVFAFAANTIPDFSNLAGVYNRYLIKRIRVVFTLIDISNSGTFADNQMPSLMCRYNYDSNMVSPTDTKLTQVTNTKSFTFTPNVTKFEYSLIPRTVAPVYLSAVASGYELQKPRYIDCQYNNVPHYGLMTYIDNLSLGFTLQLDLIYDISMLYAN